MADITRWIRLKNPLFSTEKHAFHRQCLVAMLPCVTGPFPLHGGACLLGMSRIAGCDRKGGFSAESTLYSFAGVDDGGHPAGSFFKGSDGNFHGTAVNASNGSLS